MSYVRYINIVSNYTMKSLDLFFDIPFLYKNVFPNIKMSEDSLARNYKKKRKKKGFKKTACKDIKIFLKNKTNKKQEYGCN